MPLKHIVESEEGPNCHLEPQITEEAEEEKNKWKKLCLMRKILHKYQITGRFNCKRN
jgi:hypothetical protein